MTFILTLLVLILTCKTDLFKGTKLTLFVNTVHLRSDILAFLALFSSPG